MTWRSCVLVPVALAWLSTSAQAGILFNRAKKPDPAEQVADLVKTLRTDADERHRVAAADELSKVDAKQLCYEVMTEEQKVTFEQKNENAANETHGRFSFGAGSGSYTFQANPRPALIAA